MEPTYQKTLNFVEITLFFFILKNKEWVYEYLEIIKKYGG